MKKNTFKIVVLAALSSFAASFSFASDISKFDPRMAVESAKIQGDIKWFDAKFLPIEGKAFTNTATYFERLPANVTTNVNSGVRHLKTHTSGMQLRFVTDSKRLVFKWVPRNPSLAMDHMPSTGVSGIDVYKLTENGWRYVATGRIRSSKGGELSIPWVPGAACLVNLPLYNGIKSMEVGVEKNATISPPPPRASGVKKSVVFYGTSITHGGCASRPGLSFVNILGREIDVPVVNLGFSGSGKMEMEMSEHVSSIDASCYVLDCLWNMTSKMVKERYEPFIRNLRAKRPDVPIIMAGQCDVYYEPGKKSRFADKEDFTKALYEKLCKEGWKKLYYLPFDRQLSHDLEGTVDGCHPNDLGMRDMAKAFGEAVATALELK